MLFEKNGDRCQGDPKRCFIGEQMPSHTEYVAPLSVSVFLIGEEMPSQTECGAPLSVRTSFATPIDPRNLSGDVR